jgi:hypothetical protein
MTAIGPKSSRRGRGQKMWAVREANVKLAELLKPASEGEPQITGVFASCLMMSMMEFNELTKRAKTPHLG